MICQFPCVAVASAAMPRRGSLLCRTIFLCAALLAAWTARGEVRRVLEPLKPGEIVARGWLKGQLELSLAGMGGHLGETEKIVGDDVLARPVWKGGFSLPAGRPVKLRVEFHCASVYALECLEA